MLVLGGITYASQRSFEEDRVNDQTRAAEPAVGRALDEKGVPGGHSFDPDHDQGTPPKGGGPGPEANLPPGTYGQRRAASGKVLGHVVLSYGQEQLAAPDLP